MKEVLKFIKSNCVPINIYETVLQNMMRILIYFLMQLIIMYDMGYNKVKPQTQWIKLIVNVRHKTFKIATWKSILTLFQ